MHVRLAHDQDEAAAVALAVMSALPRWFGLEEPIRGYVEAARNWPTFVAEEEGDHVVGFLTLKQHTPYASEIIAIGVMPDRHRHGAGRLLVETAAAVAKDRSEQLLQVKTLGPSHPSEPYARTRAFYAALGFLPLEETTALWGEANPCLTMIKPL